MERLPTLFVSHGSPMLALDAGRTGRAWAALAAELPRPRAIAVASAHWLTAVPAVSTTAHPATIHDFRGFPEPLFALRYEPPGAPAVAERTAALLHQAGFQVGIDPARGLDHGAWVPLANMYPAAEVPVFQLAIQPRETPEHHFRVGRALAALRDEGVLLIGSGSITHNLRELDWEAEEGRATHAYVPEFQEWLHQRLLADDQAALLDYRRQAPGAQRAHPTDEHLLPLYVALGAAGDGARAVRHYANITEGGLAMDLYAFG
ncbi:dioxygenase family protein [Chitinimonas koreensis]|uniref:dioxygenase family protein n=1 Tax=Chitinimonas koreensis TaxID=356302 RepID=UPI0004108CC8|nr:class III extradiol ring-cleavage dioxygenase [Chitinimonas koreensis]QNM97462.1 dioxygenase [Chitinimonas koreensis]